MTVRHEQRYQAAVALAAQRVKDNQLPSQAKGDGRVPAKAKDEDQLRMKLGIRASDRSQDALVASAWSKLQAKA